MNSIENRKRAYAFFDIISVDTVPILNNVKVSKNLNPSSDKKVVLGIIKEKVSFFQEDLVSLIRDYQLDSVIAKRMIEEFNNSILSYLKDKELELDLSIAQDTDLDKLDSILSESVGEEIEKKEYSEEDLYSLLYENAKLILNLTENGYKKKQSISQDFLISFWKKEVFELDFKEFLEKLNKDGYLETGKPLLFEENIFYILTEEISNRFIVDINNKEAEEINY